MGLCFTVITKLFTTLAYTNPKTSKTKETTLNSIIFNITASKFILITETILRSFVAQI